MRDAVVFDSFPSPAFSHSDPDVAHRQPPDERADHHRPQRLGAQHLRAARKQLRDERLGGLPDLRDLHLKLPLERLHPAGTKPVAQPRLVVAQPALIFGSALIASSTKPGVELVLDRALNEQPRPQLRQLRERLAGVLTHPTESSRSICSSISADGGTVRLTA
jgi:hypothetical protein